MHKNDIILLKNSPKLGAKNGDTCSYEYLQVLIETNSDSIPECNNTFHI